MQIQRQIYQKNLLTMENTSTIKKEYELDYNRAAALFKWNRVSIPMAVATVTGDVTEALYLMK